MKLVFIDETGDRKFKDYLGICVATMDSRSYPLLKRQSLEILKNAGWDPTKEFKGSFLFSASKGATDVEVEARVEAASELLDLNASDKKSRLRFAYTGMTSTDKATDYQERHLVIDFPNLNAGNSLCHHYSRTYVRTKPKQTNCR